MIFDNQLTSGDIITSTVWNRAWGYNGTAKSLYDKVGAQQHSTQIYSGFSWATSNQLISSTSFITEFNVDGTLYPSQIRSGDLSLWETSFSTANNLKNTIIIQRNGFYIINVEVGLNDSSNRIGSTANTDGTYTIPDINMFVEVLFSDNSSITIDNWNTYSFHRIPNTVNAATGNTPQFNQPYFSTFTSYVLYLNTNNIVRLKTTLSNYPARTTRFVHASLKAYLIRAT